MRFTKAFNAKHYGPKCFGTCGKRHISVKQEVPTKGQFSQSYGGVSFAIEVYLHVKQVQMEALFGLFGACVG